MNLSALSATSGTFAIRSADSVRSTSSASSSCGTVGTDSAQLSKPAELLAKLQQLMESDPEKAKEVLSQISKKLEEVAGQLGQTPEAGMLKDMAAKFQEAAETGDLSKLQPPSRPAGNPAEFAKNAYSEQGHGRHGAIPPPPPSGERDAEDDSSTTSASSVRQSVGKVFQEIKSLVASALGE